MKRRSALLGVAVLLAVFLFCSNNSLYTAGNQESVSCYAFLSDSLLSTNITGGDTIHLSLADTIHTGDSIVCVGIVLPPGGKIKDCSWNFGDGQISAEKTIWHVFKTHGVYKPVFRIEDNAGFTMSDTVMVCVNTPPDSVKLLVPVNGQTGIDPNSDMRGNLKWSCKDPDGDSLTYRVYFNTSKVFVSPIAIQHDTMLNIYDVETLTKLTTYYWMVKAFDKYGDSAVSDTFSFITKDPNAQTGSIQGYARFQGWKNQRGISISIIDTTRLVNPQYVSTNDSGFFSVSGLPPKTYKVLAVDTLKKQFLSDSCSVVVQVGGVTITDSLLLRDPFRPAISNNTPVSTQTIRKPQISVNFSDIGSGILVSSATIVVDDSNVTSSAAVTSSGLQWTPLSIMPDGSHHILVTVSDSAGNRDTLVWSFSIAAMKVFSNSDTVVEHGGSVRCSVYVQQNYGTLKFEIDTANSGNYRAFAGKDTIGTYVFTTGTACSWDSVKMRVTDSDGEVFVRGFRIRVTPWPLTITSIDSTVNTITIHFSQSQETDFAQYRIYRNTTNAVDTNSELWATISASGKIDTTSTPNYAWTPRYYRVFQIDTEGLWSAGSNVVYGSIVNSPPPRPVITYPVNNGDSIWHFDSLRWSKCVDPNGNGVKYRVLIKSNSTGYTQFATELTDTFVQLTDSLPVTVKVIAYDTFGDSSAWSVERTVLIKPVVFDIDGNVYHTVTIGTQVWMVENLKTTRYNDRTAIPLVTDGSAWGTLTTPGFCWYGNDSANYGNSYGALYNWYAVNTNILAPIGWHVPTDSEWTVLTTYLGGDGVAGGKLKESGTAHWNSPNVGATNESGFSALPGGNRGADGTFGLFALDGYWWSSTYYDGSFSWYRNISYAGASVIRNYAGSGCGYSIRCVRDY